MSYCGFEASGITYKTAPKGWADGVYHERTPEITPLAADTASSLSFFCRAFREREETGWGVYDYCEGVTFSFPSAHTDWEITAALRSRSGACRIGVICDGVKVASGADITEEAAEVRFIIRSADEVSSFCFFPEYGENAEEATAELEVLSLSRMAADAPKPGRTPTLFLASDSTVQTYDPYYYPQTGWGEVLYRFFKDSELVREYRPEGST